MFPLFYVQYIGIRKLNWQSLAEGKVYDFYLCQYFCVHGIVTHTQKEVKTLKKQLEGLLWHPSGQGSALPIQGPRVQSLVGELTSHRPCGTTKHNKAKQLSIFIVKTMNFPFPSLLFRQDREAKNIKVEQNALLENPKDINCSQLSVTFGKCTTNLSTLLKCNRSVTNLTELGQRYRPYFLLGLQIWLSVLFPPGSRRSSSCSVTLKDPSRVS